MITRCFDISVITPVEPKITMKANANGAPPSWWFTSAKAGSEHSERTVSGRNDCVSHQRTERSTPRLAVVAELVLLRMI